MKFPDWNNKIAVFQILFMIFVNFESKPDVGENFG